MIPFLLGVALFSQAASTIYASRKASTEAKYNAKIKEDQAQMAEEKKGIVAQQWDRQIQRATSTLINRVAASGITMSGSPTTALIDMGTQMQYDKAIDLYNIEWEKKGIQSEQSAYLRQSKSLPQVGYANAFSKTLLGYSDYRF